MEIKINDEVAKNSKHVLSNGDIVTIVGKDRDLSDKYEVVTLKSENGALHMPKVKMPDKVEIPSLTIDFNKIKNSASSILDKAKSMTKDDVKSKASDVIKAYQAKIDDATDALKRKIAEYVPTVLLVDLYDGKTLDLNKMYAKLGGIELTDLYVSSVKKRVPFAHVLVNGDGVHHGINDLGEDEIKVLGHFEKDDAAADFDEKEHVGNFDDLLNHLLDADVDEYKKDEEEKPKETKKEEKPAKKAKKDDDELDIDGLADLLKKIGALGDN